MSETGPDLSNELKKDIVRFPSYSWRKADICAIILTDKYRRTGKYHEIISVTQGAPSPKI